MIVSLFALFASASVEARPPDFPPAILAYHHCVVEAADHAEARTRDAANPPAPEAVFDAAEQACQPLYAPAIDAFYATTMKTEAVQAYVRGKDDKQVRAEVEAGLRDSIKEKIVQNIMLKRNGTAESAHAQN